MNPCFLMAGFCFTKNAPKTCAMRKPECEHCTLYRPAIPPLYSSFSDAEKFLYMAAKVHNPDGNG